jgi:hypothetical protein
MKERPILMTGPLVCATLDDRKTKTRRVIKPQPPRQLFGIDQNDFNTWVLASRDNPDEPDWSFSIHCPYGRVGDRLWVRETWAHVPATAYRASTGVPQTRDPTDPDHAAIYRAGWDRSAPGTRWRPSIHMPRWASRLTLEITDIQVERVQQITPRDVVAEGLYHEPGAWGPDEAYDHLIKAFAHLWDAINAKRGYAWEMNPWVWVVSYKRAPQ